MPEANKLWKLSIEQKKPYVYEGNTHYTTEKVVFKSTDLTELTMLVEKVSNCTGDCETSYKIEKAGEEE